MALDSPGQDNPIAIGNEKDEAPDHDNSLQKTQPICRKQYKKSISGIPHPGFIPDFFWEFPGQKAELIPLLETKLTCELLLLSYPIRGPGQVVNV